MNPSPLAFLSDVEFQCTLCYYQTFDQPAGRLTRVLLCGQRTEQEPHTLCFQCFCNISRNGTRSFRCPMCRSMCFPRESGVSTGETNVQICRNCNIATDEFGPRMYVSASQKDLCLSCAVQLNEHDGLSFRDIIQTYAQPEDDVNERDVAQRTTFVHDYTLQVVDTVVAVSSPISVIEGISGLRHTALRRRLAELSSPFRFRNRRTSRYGLFFLRALTTTTAGIDYDEMMSRFRLLLDLASDAWESPSDIPEEYTNEFLRRLRIFLCSSIGDTDISHMHSSDLRTLFARLEMVFGSQIMPGFLRNILL